MLNNRKWVKYGKNRNIQVIDNKDDELFYFPMISMTCTGIGIGW